MGLKIEFEVVSLFALLGSRELSLLLEELEGAGCTPACIHTACSEEEALALALDFFKKDSRLILFTPSSTPYPQADENKGSHRLQRGVSALFLEEEKGSCLIHLRRREDFSSLCSQLPANWWEQELHFVRTFYLFPIVEERIAPLLARFPSLEARSAFQEPQLKVHFFGLKSEAERFFQEMRSSLAEKLRGIYLGERPLPEEVGAALKEKGLSLAVIESCTGGLLSHLLTNLPGSSDYFHSGLIPYRTEAKISLAGIDRDFFRKHEVVSQETALALARRARFDPSIDLGLGVTGFAGPGGGSRFAPVGTVYIACTSREREEAQEFHLSGSREEVKHQAALQAVFLLYNFLSGINSKAGLPLPASPRAPHCPP